MARRPPPRVRSDSLRATSPSSGPAVTPPFVIVPALTITRSNLVDGYRELLGRAPPASVVDALGE